LAQSAEEREFDREAKRLADHEVDQAFSQSPRQASLEKPNLSGKTLALQQRVTELQETIKNDQARIVSLSAGAGTRPASADDGRCAIKLRLKPGLPIRRVSAGNPTEGLFS
jgi:hypothetical protein